MQQKPEGMEDRAQGSVSNQGEFNPGTSFRGVIKARRTPGVAISSIKNKFASVKRFARLTVTRRVSPGGERRDGMKNFVSYVQNRGPARRPLAIQRQPSEWRKLDMVLPNGSVVGESRARPTGAQLFDSLPKGQVIPPFRPPDTSSPRQVRRAAPKPAPAPSRERKAPQPRERMFSKVEEITSSKPPTVSREVEPAARDEEDIETPKEQPERDARQKPIADRQVIRREPEKRPISRPVEEPADEKGARLDEVTQEPPEPPSAPAVRREIGEIVRREPSAEKLPQPARDEPRKKDDILKPIDQPPAPPKVMRREEAAPPKVEKAEEPERPEVDREPPAIDRISEPLDAEVVRRFPDEESPPKPIATVSDETGAEAPEFRPIIEKFKLKPPEKMMVVKAPTRIIQRSPAPEPIRRPPDRLDQPPLGPSTIKSDVLEDDAPVEPTADLRPPLESRPREPLPSSKQPAQQRQYIAPVSRKTVHRQPGAEREPPKAAPLISRRRTVRRKAGSQDLFIGRRQIQKRIQRKEQQKLQQKRDLRSIGEKIGRPVVQRQVTQEASVDRAARLVSPAAEDLAAVRRRRAEYGTAQTLRRMPAEPAREAPPRSAEQEMPIVRTQRPSSLKDIVQRAIDPAEPPLETGVGEGETPAESFEWGPEEPEMPSMPDLRTIARRVFPLIRRMLAQERERSLGKHF
jgi:hypothetical protein